MLEKDYTSDIDISKIVTEKEDIENYTKTLKVYFQLEDYILQKTEAMQKISSCPKEWELTNKKVKEILKQLD